MIRLRYVCLGILTLISVSLMNLVLAEDPEVQISDVPIETPIGSPKPEVAREIAEIKRQLGGSIVRNHDFYLPNPYKPQAMPTLRYPTQQDDWTGEYQGGQLPTSPVTPRSPTEEKIEILRAAAAQLDVVASRMESVELYLQADQLRESAQEFRLEARGLRKTATSALPNQ